MVTGEFQEILQLGKLMDSLKILPELRHRERERDWGGGGGGGGGGCGGETEIDIERNSATYIYNKYYMTCEMHTEHYLLPKRMVTDDHLLQVLPVTVNEQGRSQDFLTGFPSSCARKN